MNISAIFIRRPIATTLLMTGILLFGLVSYELLPVAALPNVEFPTIVVTAQLPGANPTTMAETIATPLENEFTQIQGLSQMTSTSGLGQTSITLQFDLSIDINAAAGQVQQEINAASGLLPKNMPTPPTYRETNPADRPVLIYAVHSDAMPVYELDTYANTILAQSLSTVPGVGQVSIGGQQQPAVAVQVDPEALASRGLSLSQISTALSGATLESPKGELEGPQQQFTLNTNDQLLDADQFRDVIVAYQNGAPVRLRDLGTIIDSSQSPFSGAWYDRQPAELLLIFRTAGANTVQVVDDVKAKLPQLQK
jgi:multidrug efflux pump subunit AcrB